MAWNFLFGKDKRYMFHDSFVISKNNYEDLEEALNYAKCVWDEN